MAGSAAVHRLSFLPPPPFSSAAALNLPRLPSSSTAASLSPFPPCFLSTSTTHLPSPFFLLPVLIADVVADLLAFSVLGRRRSFAAVRRLPAPFSPPIAATSPILPLFSREHRRPSSNSPPSPVAMADRRPLPFFADTRSRCHRRRFSTPPGKPHLHPFLLFLLLCVFSLSVTVIRTPSASPLPSSSTPALASVAASLFSSAVASSLRLPLLSLGSDKGKEKALLLLLLV